MNLRMYADEFYASKAASGRSPETVFTYQRHCELFIAWANKNGFVDSDLVGTNGAETIEEFMLHEANRGLGPTTIASGYRHLRALYRWIEKRHGRMEQGNPFDIMSEPKKPELPIFFPHAFRHGCAVAIIERGGDISLVSKILGHSDIRTSNKYLRFDTDAVTTLYDRIFD